MVASIIVYTNPYKLPALLPWIKEWWAYVTVTPDDNNITVFNKGNSKGFIDWIPIGGHCAPNSMLGDKALWKKAQKIAKKNKASDTINKATPIFIPLWTAKVWFPIYVASDITSLNHKAIVYMTKKRAKKKTVDAWAKLCIVNTPVVVSVNKLKLIEIGQGDGVTKWNGWAWKLLLVKLVIFCFVFISYYVVSGKYFILIYILIIRHIGRKGIEPSIAGTIEFTAQPVNQQTEPSFVYLIVESKK
jgi:hypothetical protein